jgi:hypothetical protein
MERKNEATDQTAAEQSAADRPHESLHDLKDNLAGRAEKLRTRHQEQSLEWQRNLEQASDEALLGLGIELVRAQRTSQALDAMADEIKRRKRELPWGA